VLLEFTEEASDNASQLFAPKTDIEVVLFAPGPVPGPLAGRVAAGIAETVAAIRP
jgi:hypothetical protein